MRHPLRYLLRVFVVIAASGLWGLGCQKKRIDPALPPATPAPSASPADTATIAAPSSPVANAPSTAQAGAPETPAEAAGAPSTPTPPPGARCSASTLSPEPGAPAPPLPKAVESMRRRIVAAAVACDYKTLSALSREKGKDFSFTFGPESDLAAAWRRQEKQGQPVLAQLVKVLSLPYVKLDTLYVWPSVYGPEAAPEDWSALRGLYSAEEIRGLRAYGAGYVGFRTGIDKSGDWQFAIAGD